MRYKPIESRNDALDRIAGLGYGEFSIVSYEENWQREQGEPDIEITRDVEYAVDRFFTLCGRAVCVELRGIHWGDRPGSERGRGVYRMVETGTGAGFPAACQRPVEG